MCIICVMDNEYTTKQVADALGVPKRTLLSWLNLGLLSEPRFAPYLGMKKFRWWSDADLLRAAKLAARLTEKKRKRSTT
jgi:DNA-binding transcriptional MerR regulator